MSIFKNPTLLTALLCAGTVASYVGYRLTTDSVDNSATLAADNVSPRPLADSLPDFTLDDLDGVPTPISTWAGKPMLINFWATWCVPCLREIPLLKTFQDENPSIQVIGIAVDVIEPVLAFAEEMDFNYPVLVGRAGGMNAASAFGFDLVAMPATLFTTANGATLGVHFGEIHPEHLENLTATLEQLEAGTIDLSTARERMAGRL